MKLEQARQQWERDMRREASKEQARLRRVAARRRIEDYRLAEKLGLSVAEVQGL